MPKMIQLKDSNNENIYPRGIIDILLDKPLQANNSSNVWVTSTLLRNYINYDIVACRVSVGNNGLEGNWVFVFPKVGVQLQVQFSIKIYEGYYYGGKISLTEKNKVNFSIQHQTGWSYNSFYLSKVIGIKMT